MRVQFEIEDPHLMSSAQTREDSSENINVNGVMPGAAGQSA